MRNWPKKRNTCKESEANVSNVSNEFHMIHHKIKSSDIFGCLKKINELTNHCDVNLDATIVLQAQIKVNKN